MNTIPSESSASRLTAWIKERAGQYGFSGVGCCPAAPSASWDRLAQWLEAGYAGDMDYLPDRLEAYRHPSSVLQGVRSIVMLSMDYRTQPPADVQSGAGRVSRYAWGLADYHDVIHARLKKLAEDIKELRPEARVRGVVDTAPLLERELARLAGLGWIGKHTLLLNRHQGSWFFLAALLLDVDLVYDDPYATDHCGTCTACLDACPTRAFPQPYVLDATRCISYLTIELRQSIPRELRTGMGDWVFGCDVCQDVCPWNRRAPAATVDSFEPREDLYPLELCELFEIDDAAFRARFRKSPLWRAKRRGLLRNAAIVLGNQLASDARAAAPTESDVQRAQFGADRATNWPAAALRALRTGLNDAESVVRVACAWALAQAQQPACERILAERLEIEDVDEVRHEIQLVLAGR